MLAAHRDIAVGYECDFFEALAPRYGPLPDLRPIWGQFIDDLQAVNRFAFWGLEASDLHATIYHRATPLLYPDAVRLIAETYLQKTKPQARIFGFKNPNSVERLDQFFGLFPNARVLHITRDPRAVLASQLTKARCRGHSNSPLETVRVGRRFGRAQRALDRFSKDPRVLHVSYSDLINDPAQHLQKICGWLGVRMDVGMLPPDLPRSGQTRSSPARNARHPLQPTPDARQRCCRRLPPCAALAPSALGHRPAQTPRSVPAAKVGPPSGKQPHCH